jgi:hypothetical protein
VSNDLIYPTRRSGLLSESFVKFCMGWLCDATRPLRSIQECGSLEFRTDLIRVGSDHGSDLWSDPMVKGDGPKGDGQLDHGSA